MDGGTQVSFLNAYEKLVDVKFKLFICTTNVSVSIYAVLSFISTLKKIYFLSKQNRI